MDAGALGRALVDVKGPVAEKPGGHEEEACREKPQACCDRRLAEAAFVGWRTVKSSPVRVDNESEKRSAKIEERRDERETS